MTASFFRGEDRLRLVWGCLVFLLSWSLSSPAKSSLVVPGYYLIKYSGGAPLQSSAIGVQSITPLASEHIYRVKMDTSVAPQVGVQTLRGVPGVEACEPLRLYPVMASAQTPYLTPADPAFTNQWYLPKIEAPQAWDLVVGSSNIVVAIIDTGVELRHTDITAALWQNSGEISGNGIDDDHNGYIDDVVGWDFVDLGNDAELADILAQVGSDPQEDYTLQDDTPEDVCGHGTHVAGIVAGSQNSVGISGVAAGVRLMVLKAAFRTASDAYFTSETIINAIAYARKNGARIINMSFGDVVDDPLIHQELQSAYRQGIFLVAAAGNAATEAPNYPAAIPFVFSVGATNSSDQRTSFSSYGAWVDLAAPGESILSAVSNTNNIPVSKLTSKILDNKLAYLSGTSMASPMIAGVAALLLTVAPSLSPDSLDYFLKQSADRLDPGSGLGWGRLNAYRAIQSVLATASSGATPSDLIKKLYIVPNPVLPTTVLPVKFKLQLSTPVSTVSSYLYRQSGACIWSQTATPGSCDLVYAIPWEARSDRGEVLPAGIYYLLVKVTAQNGQQQSAKTKLLVVR